MIRSMVELVTLAQGVSTLAGIALFGFAYRAYAVREQASADSFAVLLVVLGVMAVCAGLTAHVGVAYKLVWLYTGLAIPVAMAFFVFDYYGLEFLGSRSQVVAVVTPAVVGAFGGTLLVLGTPAMSPGTAPPAASVAALPAVALELAPALNEIGFYYTTALMLLAVGLVFRTVYRYDHLDTRLGSLLSFVGVWPWVANLAVPNLVEAVSLGAGIAAIGLGYTASMVVTAVAIGPLDLFGSSPAAGNVAPDAVIDSMDDAVVVVDDGEVVLRMNEAACRTFGTAESAAVGGPLSTVLGRSLDEFAAGETVGLDTADGVRQFEVTRSTVTDRTGDDRGHAVVLRDVTRRQTREQRLQVLNRVLRHNLRNDATSIMGRAELIKDGRDDPAASAEVILDTTQELVEAAERAREIEGMMNPPAGDTTTAVGSVFEEVAAEVDGEYPAVEVTTAVPEGATAAVSRSVFRPVLRNLVENAAEHGDADEPIVVVSGDYTADGGVEVAVADNGPGIPDHERAVLEAGGEDPLRHGSGLGLWAAQWGVAQMGGTLSFEENQPRGSVVTVTVPAADGAAVEEPATEPVASD